MSLDELRALLARMDESGRRAALQALRQEFGVAIHHLETEWRVSAEAILDAIHSAPDLTQRGVRGVLAEAIFRTVVLPDQLQGWRSIPFTGDLPYDLLLEDGKGSVKVQVKNQRREEGAPKINKKLTEKLGYQVFVVETQRTRTGHTKRSNGKKEATRPYRFGEFDVLAVCLQPSSGDWADFIYCPTRMLQARPKQPKLLNVMQPIYKDGSEGWTRSFDAAVRAFRKSER